MEETAFGTERSAGALRRAGKATARRIVDTILPPRCLACGTVVADPGTVCSDCWRGIAFLGPPWCACCGLPFPYDAGDGALCGDCARERPPYDRARSAMVYDDASRDLILAFKHADRTDAAAAFGDWLARAGAEILPGTDLIVPVPLHRRRLLARRYNQSALLALALSKRTGVPALVDGLVRTRATPSQGRLNRAQRQRNVQGAFSVRPARKTRIAGKSVLLVDDVLTTGATLGACARALRRGGAARVDVVTIARVTRTG